MDSSPDTGLWVDQTPYIPDPTTDISFAGEQGVGPDPVGVVGDTASGFGSLSSDLLTLGPLVAKLIKSVGGLISDIEGTHPLAIFGVIAPLLKKTSDLFSIVGNLLSHPPSSGVSTVVEDVADDAYTVWDWIMRLTWGNLYSGLLFLGLGVKPWEFDEDAQKGVNTVDSMIGFAMFMPIIVGTIEHVGKVFLGQRWGHMLHEALEKLPEEMGLSWAMGLQIDEAFKVAVGRSIEEGINRQKRGNRIDWPQVRTLLKQHAIEEPEYVELLQNHGFPDHQIDLLKRLQDVQVPVGDIAQLWYRDVIDDAKALELIETNGFTREQSQWLFDMYMKKSQNEASSTYRTTGRQLFVAHLITEDQYRSILVRANYPSKMIEEDIAAILLEQQVGRILHSVTVIKQRYMHHDLDPTTARNALRELNYSDDYITELLQTWGYQPLRRQHGLSQSKILSYLISGVLKPDQARTQLLASGLTPDAADFLIAHPKATPGTKVHARTPGLVTAAYVDGAILLSDLSAAFTSAGVADTDLAYYMDIAKYRLAHKKGAPGSTQEPNTALVREAQKAGLIDFQHAVTMYEQLGWSPDWAMTIAEIVNKGPYQAPGTPAFATPDDAMAYMTALGYLLIPPMDPRLLAAESMLAMLGWSWQAPPAGGHEGGLPPPGGLPPGGIVQPPTLPPA